MASQAKAQFARRLRVVREGAGFTSMKAFAQALDLEEETYRAYERGENEPPLWVLGRIHLISGVSLDFLIAGALPVADQRPASPHISDSQI